MLHKDSRSKIRVGKPFLQLTTSGKCHYQFGTESWIVFDTLSEAIEFIQDRLNVEETGGNVSKINKA